MLMNAYVGRDIVEVQSKFYTFETRLYRTKSNNVVDVMFTNDIVLTKPFNGFLSSGDRHVLERFL